MRAGAAGRWVMSSTDHQAQAAFNLLASLLGESNANRYLRSSRSYVAANMTQSNNFTPLKLINTIDDIWKYAKVKIHWAVAHTERKKCSRVKEVFGSRTFYESNRGVLQGNLLFFSYM